ncbi:MAG: hypothetical protein AAGA03_14670, partial [Planctomycetota bacterium]
MITTARPHTPNASERMSYPDRRPAWCRNVPTDAGLIPALSVGAVLLAICTGCMQLRSPLPESMGLLPRNTAAENLAETAPSPVTPFHRGEAADAGVIRQVQYTPGSTQSAFQNPLPRAGESNAAVATEGKEDLGSVSPNQGNGRYTARQIPLGGPTTVPTPLPQAAPGVLPPPNSGTPGFGTTTPTAPNFAPPPGVPSPVPSGVPTYGAPSAGITTVSPPATSLGSGQPITPLGIAPGSIGGTPSFGATGNDLFGSQPTLPPVREADLIVNG